MSSQFDIVSFLSVTALGPEPGLCVVDLDGWGLSQEGWQALAQFSDNAQLLTVDIFSADFAWAAGGYGLVRPLDPMLSSPRCRVLPSSVMAFSTAPSLELTTSSIKGSRLAGFKGPFSCFHPS